MNVRKCHQVCKSGCRSVKALRGAQPIKQSFMPLSSSCIAHAQQTVLALRSLRANSCSTQCPTLLVSALLFHRGSGEKRARSRRGNGFSLPFFAGAATSGCQTMDRRPVLPVIALGRRGEQTCSDFGTFPRVFGHFWTTMIQSGAGSTRGTRSWNVTRSWKRGTRNWDNKLWTPSLTLLSSSTLKTSFSREERV